MKSSTRWIFSLLLLIFLSLIVRTMLLRWLQKKEVQQTTIAQQASSVLVIHPAISQPEITLRLCSDTDLCSHGWLFKAVAR
jgi:hypothetical protein